MIGETNMNIKLKAYHGLHPFQNHESIVTYRNKQQNYILRLMIVWLVEIEMLNPIHELEWALSFIIPRKLKQPGIGKISSILEQPLRVLNKRVVYVRIIRLHYGLSSR